MRSRGTIVVLVAGAAACGPETPISERPAVTPPQAPSTADLFEPVAPPWSPDECCFYHVEMESLDGPWRTQTNIEPYYGLGFRTSGLSGRTADTSVTSTVAMQAGRYVVWTHAYADDTDRSFVVHLDGIALEPTHGSTSAVGFRWYRAGEITLEDGVHDLQVRDAGTGFETPDAVIFTTDPELHPESVEDYWRLLRPETARTVVRQDAVQRARDVLEALSGTVEAETWSTRAGELRRALQFQLGLDPWPERTPLASEVHGVVAFDGYRIERVSFESRPGFVVNAHVYVPDGAGPFPVVLSPLGHGLSIRSTLSASRNHRLAQLGFITLTYDPFGQGERNIYGNDHGNHWTLTLSGHSNMSMMVWDSMRALDYMLSRPDVDPSRTAVTGYSGGGLNTLYFSALDDRLDVAVPVAYVTSFEAFLATGHGHDPCTYAPGVARFTDMGEVAATFAPKPYLILAGDDDPSFPVSGTRDAAALAEARYEALAAEQHVELASFPVGHTYHRPMRERMYGFMSRYLDGGDGDPIPEGVLELPDPDDPALLVFEGGRVPAASKRVRDFAREWAQEALEALPRPEAFSANETIGALFDLLQPPALEPPELTPTRITQTPFGLESQDIVVGTSPGVEVPAHAYLHDATGPLVMLTVAAGRTNGSYLARARRAGMSIVVVQPRGRGETEERETWAMASNLLLGSAIVGQRAFDLVQVRRALDAWSVTSGRPVALVALSEESSLAALFAQAMYGSFDAVWLGPQFGSYLDAFSTRLPWSAYVFDILSTADVPQLLYLAGERPLSVALRPTSWMTPAWREALEDRITTHDDGRFEDAMAWVRAQLEP